MRDAKPVRTDLQGRNPESVQYELAKLRTMPPERRLAIALDLIASMEHLRKATRRARIGA